MNAATAAVRPTRREDLVEVVWRFFSSLGLVIPLILALALASVAGTFLAPAAAGLAEVQQTLEGRWWWRLYLAFELYDVFRSWWFTALLVLLALSIVACTIERLPRIAWVVLNPDRRLTDKVARGLRNVSRLKAGADAGAESARVAAAFRARGFAPRIVKEGKAVYLFAQRAPWSRFGVWIVYLSLLVMLGGGIAGRLHGFEGTVDVAPGGALDSILVRTGPGEAYRRSLPFVARVNDFEVQLDESGTPRVFRSNVSLSDREGRPIPGKQDVDVTVNHPLREQGLTIYQASYREDPTGSRARIAIADRTSGQRQPHVLTRGEAVEVGGVRFSVEGYTPRYGVLGPAVQIRRVEGDRATTFWVFQERPEFDAQNRPDRYAVEFTGLKKVYLTGLRIAHEPGAVWVLWVGCVLFVCGLLVAFFAVHRRLWARVEPGTIVLAGSSHRSATRFEEMLAELGEALARPAAEGRGTA